MYVASTTYPTLNLEKVILGFVDNKLLPYSLAIFKTLIKMTKVQLSKPGQLQIKLLNKYYDIILTKNK